MAKSQGNPNVTPKPPKGIRTSHPSQWGTPRPPASPGPDPNPSC